MGSITSAAEAVLVYSFSFNLPGNGNMSRNVVLYNFIRNAVTVTHPMEVLVSSDLNLRLRGG